MICASRRLLAGGILCCLLLVSFSFGNLQAAQVGPARVSNADWTRLVQAGKGARIRLTVADGGEVQGTVVKVADDLVVVRGPEELTVARSNVATVEVLSGRPWSMGKKIALIGALAGAGLVVASCVAGCGR